MMTALQIVTFSPLEIAAKRHHRTRGLPAKMPDYSIPTLSYYSEELSNCRRLGPNHNE